jgi:hypothetical protein
MRFLRCAKRDTVKFSAAYKMMDEVFQKLPEDHDDDVTM